MNKIKFTSGFTINNVPYGVMKGELYRLPYTDSKGKKRPVHKMAARQLKKGTVYDVEGRSMTMMDISKLATIISVIVKTERPEDDFRPIFVADKNNGGKHVLSYGVPWLKSPL
jgi:hypothetical protein